MVQISNSPREETCGIVCRGQGTRLSHVVNWVDSHVERALFFNATSSILYRRATFDLNPSHYSPFSLWDFPLHVPLNVLNHFCCNMIKYNIQFRILWSEKALSAYVLKPVYKQVWIEVQPNTLIWRALGRACSYPSREEAKACFSSLQFQSAPVNWTGNTVHKQEGRKAGVWGDSKWLLTCSKTHRHGICLAGAPSKYGLIHSSSGGTGISCSHSIFYQTSPTTLNPVHKTEWQRRIEGI